MAMTFLKESPLVSIVVPVYNIGNYARYCVTSLLAQTYFHIEILIVDDGCTDNTIQLIDDLVKDDSRVEILHKENGGLSSARNYGAERCTGDYIMFVDGDDVLDARTVELLVKIALENDVPLVTCKYIKLSSAEGFRGGRLGSTEIVSGNQLLKSLLLLDGESGSACAKLYARDLLPLLVFPEGQLFEDFGVMAGVFSCIKSACISDDELYGYVTREGSITTAKKYGDAHLSGMEKSLATVKEIVSSDSDLLDAYACFEAFCMLRVAFRLDADLCQNKEEATHFVKEARRCCRAASFSRLAGKTWRVRCALFSLSPKLHNALYRLYCIATGKASA